MCFHLYLFVIALVMLCLDSLLKIIVESPPSASADVTTVSLIVSSDYDTVVVSLECFLERIEIKTLLSVHIGGAASSVAITFDNHDKNLVISAY